MPGAYCCTAGLCGESAPTPPEPELLEAIALIREGPRRVAGAAFLLLGGCASWCNAAARALLIY